MGASRPERHFEKGLHLPKEAEQRERFKIFQRWKAVFGVYIMQMPEKETFYGY